MQTLIRAARLEDRDALVALDRRVINANFRPLFGDEEVDVYLGSGDVERHTDEKLEHTAVMEADGVVAGMVVVEGNLIDLLMVDSGRQRRGLGSQLLSHAEHGLFAQYAELELHSFAMNGQANAFYRKHGWREERRFFDTEAGVDTIDFRKRA